MMNPTASSIERAMECPASCVLPRVHDITDESERGTSIHKFVRRVLRGISYRDAIVHVAEKWQETCASIDWKALVGGVTKIESERAFAVDVESHAVRFLGEDIGRNYPPIAPSEFVGTEDFGGVGADGLPETSDLKTGWDRVTDTKDNKQVAFFATYRHLATGSDHVRGSIKYLRDDGSIHTDAHVFTRIEFEEYLDDLHVLRDRIEAARVQYATTGTVTTFPGRWCRYCPSVSACPSKIALARVMAGEAWDIAGQIATMTPEQKGVAWVRAKEIETLLEVVLEGLKDCARVERFPTRGGAKEVRESTSNRTNFVQARAIELLHQLGASRAQIDSLYSMTVIPVVREFNVPKLLPAKRAKKGHAA